MSGINNQPIVIVLNKHKINAANFIFSLPLFFILILNNMESQIFKITNIARKCNTDRRIRINI